MKGILSLSKSQSKLGARPMRLNKKIYWITLIQIARMKNKIQNKLNNRLQNRKEKNQSSYDHQLTNAIKYAT